MVIELRKHFYASDDERCWQDIRCVELTEKEKAPLDYDAHDLRVKVFDSLATNGFDLSIPSFVLPEDEQVTDILDEPIGDSMWENEGMVSE